MLHGITPLADYHSIYENLSLHLFAVFKFYSISQNDSFCFMNGYSWNKMKKNEFTFSFKIKTAISLWYANIKKEFTVSPRLVELWGLYKRTFERQSVSLKADMDISSVTLREQKRSRSDFYSQQNCASKESKARTESSPRWCINKEFTSDSGLFLWLVEYPVPFIFSHVVSVLSA